MSEQLPILYALQWHPNSAPQAMALASLMADIEDKPQDKMAFMFCPRKDCVVDTAVELNVRSKFTDVKVFRCTNQATGWPQGPNAMMHEIYSMFASKCNTEGPDRWKYSALFLGEPDCVPLCRDWISRVYNEWHTCDWNWPMGNTQLVMGHWMTRHDNAHGMVHINGNMLISPKFINAYPAFIKTSAGAWDTTHCRGLMEYARPSKTIFSDYNVGGTDPAKPWRGCDDLFKPRTITGPFPIERETTRPAYLHGVKDPRAIGCVRSRLGIDHQLSSRFSQK